MRGNTKPEKPTTSGERAPAQLFDQRTDLERQQILLPKDLRKQLKRASFDEERSMSEIVRDGLELYFRQRG